MRRALVVAAIAGVGLADGGAGADPSPPRYTQTAVRVAADGSMTVTHCEVTRAEQLIEQASRKAGAAPVPGRIVDVAVDSACAGSSFWLYDQPDLAGNEICVAGSGAVDLTQLDDTCVALDGVSSCSTWADAKKSYWAGAAAGNFYGTSEAPGQACAAFRAHGEEGTLASCEADARWLRVDELPVLASHAALPDAPDTYLVSGEGFTGQAHCTGNDPQWWSWNPTAGSGPGLPVYRYVLAADGSAGSPCITAITCTDDNTGMTASWTPTTPVCPISQGPTTYAP